MDVFLGLSIPKVGQPRYRSPRESDQSAVETAALRMLAGCGEVITAHLVNFRFDAGHMTAESKTESQSRVPLDPELQYSGDRCHFFFLVVG